MSSQADEQAKPCARAGLPWDEFERKVLRDDYERSNGPERVYRRLKGTRPMEEIHRQASAAGLDDPNKNEVTQLLNSKSTGAFLMHALTLIVAWGAPVLAVWSIRAFRDVVHLAGSRDLLLAFKVLAFMGAAAAMLDISRGNGPYVSFGAYVLIGAVGLGIVFAAG